MKSLHRVVGILAGLILAAGSLPSQGGVYDTWGYRMKIRMAGYDKAETLTNFTSLVVLNTGIPGFQYSDFHSPTDGADLRFAASDATTELNYEIEKWNTNGNSYVWVQVPTVASSNDYIYAYWGKAVAAPPCTTNGATWNDGFKGVWHLSETSGTQADSTINRNNTAMSGTVLQGITGLIGGADECTSGYEFTTGNLGITGNSPRTVAIWFKQDAVARKAVAGFGVYGGNCMFDVLLLGGVMAHFYGLNATPVPYTAGIWQQAAITYDGTAVRVYVNGQLGIQENFALTTGDAPLYIGAGKYDGSINGMVDEVQISSVVRSANWIYAAWLNQLSNSTFLAFSDAGLVASSLTVQADPASGLGATNATLNGTVLHAGDAENPEIYICWDETDKGIASLSDWAHPLSLGTNWGKGQSFSTNITGLLLGSSYVYRCYATNSTGFDWSDTAVSFTTILGPGVTNLGATHIARVSATLRGQISDTGGQAPSTWLYYWQDGSDTTNTAALGTQSGSFASNVTGLAAGLLYHFSILASNSAGAAWSGTADFQTRSMAAHDWYVASDGDGSYATNWATAIPSIQEALNNAASNDTIYLKGERFSLDQQVTWSISDVSVLGDYEGNGLPGNRDAATWPTILTRASGTTHRIFYISGVTNGLLSGVSVTNGYALYTGPNGGAAHPASSGGGLYLSGCANFTMDDCRVLYNQGYNPSQNGGDIYGGGIFMEGSSITLTNCVIASNKVDAIYSTNIQYGDGGGLALYSGTCWINNCFVIGNFARGDGLHGQNKGGGLYLNGTATVRQSIVQFNDSASSGYYTGMGDGVYIGSSGNVLLENCLVTDNHGGDSGVAFWQVGGTLRLVNCTVATNKNYGILCNGGTAEVTNSILWANGDDVNEVVSGAVKLNSSIIEDGDSQGVNGCSAANPRFVDWQYYHEESPFGQYEGGYFAGGSWGTGAAISPAVDGGAATSAYGLEPEPNGARINMGTYGDTAVAAKSYPLSVTNRSASAIGSANATLNGTLLHVGSSNVTAWIYYGLTDGLTDAANWDTNVLVGVMSSTGAISAAVSDLVSGSPYYYTCFVSNSAGATAWGSPSTNFTPTLSAPVVVNRGVLNPAGPLASLQGEVTSTGGEDPAVYVCWGTLAGGTTTSSWQHVVAMGTRTGAFSTDVGVDAGSNYFYTCFATNSGGGNWAAPSMPFGAYRIRYVAADATGLGTGYSWEDAFTTLQDALSDCVDSETNLVYLKGGTYPLLIPVTWNHSHITLRGGYEGSGLPGNADAALWPTVLTNAGGVARLLDVTGASDGRIENLVFSGGNVGGNGGALSVESTTNLVVSDCIFRGNQASSMGGAVYVNASTGFTLQRCVLSVNTALNNSAVAGGGAFYAAGSSGTITNCVIERNRVSSTFATWGAVYQGGGLSILGGAWTIRDSRICYNNVSGYLVSGGGINLSGGTHSIRNCIVAQNDCTGYWSMVGDGIAVTDWTGYSLTLENCTIYGNGGEGINVWTGSPAARNCILWANGDDLVAGGGGGAVAPQNCDIEDGDSLGVNGCISVHPLFERGFYLAAGSPCFDAGSDTAAAFGLDGYTTRADGVPDNTGNVDLGYHALTGMPVATADLYVKPTGDNGASGTSWDAAFQTLTRALSVATEGSHIHVAAGSYTNGTETFPLALNRVGLQLLGTNSATTLIDAFGSNQGVVDMTDNAFGRIEGVTIANGGTIPYYGSGAGLYVLNADEAAIASCIITNNRAGRDGAGLYVGDSIGVTVTNCVFAGNILDVADRDNTRVGGGFYGANSYGILSNCLFNGNVTRVTQHGASTTMTRGGGLGLSGGAWTVAQAAIVNNTTHSDTYHGYNARAAGFYIVSGTHLFRNCLVANNSLLVAPQYAFGAGVDVAAGTLTLENVTVATNGAEGLRVDGGAVVVSNSIVWGNILDVTNAAGTVTFGYSDIGTPAEYAAANGCVSIDPLFVDTTYCHLQSKSGNYINGYFSGGTWGSSPAFSPLIDQGNPASDFRQEPRPHGNRINLGAYGNTPVASMSDAAAGTVFSLY